jgi:flavin reductase (DIM6/NTAB) family NADH-FMN oxidoreductase RutF
VAVVTATRRDGTCLGITVNSFASVSLEPPLVQFALHTRSSALSAFGRGAPYCIGVLRATQRLVSEACARPGSLDWSRVPVHLVDDERFAISDTLATFACRVEKPVLAGDHVIVIGVVEGACWEASGEALAYFRGRYEAMSGEPPSGESARELAASLHSMGWG